MKDIAVAGDWNKDLEAKFKALVEGFKATQTW
jgi:hypothetical protein